MLIVHCQLDILEQSVGRGVEGGTRRRPHLPGGPQCAQERGPRHTPRVAVENAAERLQVGRGRDTLQGVAMGARRAIHGGSRLEE